MNNEFDTKILDRIHTERLEPRSRWYFISEQWFFVAIIAITTFIGSIAITTSLFVLTDHDWFAVQYLDEGLFVHIIKTIPYVWFAIILGSVFLIEYNIKKVGHGYRYASWKVIALSLIASISIGTALFFAGAGTYLDTYFDRAIPVYRTLVPNNTAVWVYPEQGLLSGKVQTVTDTTIELIDGDDQSWTVLITPHTDFQPSEILPGKRIKLTGTMTDGNHFTATEIFPWRNERK